MPMIIIGASLPNISDPIMLPKKKKSNDKAEAPAKKFNTERTGLRMSKRKRKM
ncbi:hypothetical protein [Bartonella tribocorum]|uniref:hypothetical protein n=1 Tax=Bartonella tribocorum TaxID=85701 RepID=UPI0015DE5628|nr:hypothetical protein [Bartonella tribocorum]